MPISSDVLLRLTASGPTLAPPEAEYHYTLAHTAAVASMTRTALPLPALNGASAGAVVVQLHSGGGAEPKTSVAPAGSMLAAVDYARRLLRAAAPAPGAFALLWAVVPRRARAAVLPPRVGGWAVASSVALDDRKVQAVSARLEPLGEREADAQRAYGAVGPGGD